MDGGTAAVISAIGVAIVAIIGLWFTKRKEVRQDEVSVLHQSIAELRIDRDAIRQELRELHVTRETERKAREIDLGNLRDEHTACLLNQERQALKIQALEDKIVILEEMQHGTHPSS